MNKLEENKSDLPEESFADGIIAVEGYNYIKPAKKDFFPWHRPRKQFVRQMQWTQLIGELIAEKRPENNLIKYLGLPGDDLLDLRHFHDHICRPQNLKIRFLGFNKGFKAGEDHDAQLEISLDEVNRLENVDQESDLTSHDLTAISRDNSVPLQKAKALGPYDVINIDLCDGFAKRSPEKFKETHYSTLHRLMSLQARRPDPWLLFLTTRTDSDGVDDGVFKTLIELFKNNLAECPPFNTICSEHFSVTNEETLSNYYSEPEGFSNVFVTSLAKWILKMGLDQNPQVKVEIKSVMGYKVAEQSACPDLVSIAIKISPVLDAAPDPLNLARQVSEALNECTLAAKVIKRVSSQKDVDYILANNDSLMNDMIQASSNLLLQARYDIGGYEAYARSF
jgi:hypothetical protein